LVRSISIAVDNRERGRESNAQGDRANPKSHDHWNVSIGEKESNREKADVREKRGRADEHQEDPDTHDVTPFSNQRSLSLTLRSIAPLDGAFSSGPVASTERDAAADAKRAATTGSLVSDKRTRNAPATTLPAPVGEVKGCVSPPQNQAMIRNVSKKYSGYGDSRFEEE
jgi:hypothetical protein